MTAAATAWADTCSDERRILTETLERNGVELVNEGFFNDAFGTCKISSMELKVDGREVVVGTLEWTAEGLSAITTGTGQAKLDAKLRGLRIEAPRPEAGAFQSRKPPLRISGDVSASWNLGTGDAVLENLSLELPGQSGLSASLAAGGLTAESFDGGLFDLAGATLGQLEFVMTNRGFFDAGTFGPMADMPMVERDEVLAEAKAAIESISDEVLTDASSAALLTFVDAFPNPRGTLAITLDADPPLSLLRASAVGLAPQALTSAALRFFLSNADIDIEFTPADRAR